MTHEDYAMVIVGCACVAVGLRTWKPALESGKPLRGLLAAVTLVHGLRMLGVLLWRVHSSAQ